MDNKHAPVSSAKSNMKNFVNNTFFGSDIGFLLTIIIVLVGISFMTLVSFENLHLIRNKFVNNLIGIVLSIFFIYILYNFSGNMIKIKGRNIDVGYFLYLFIIIGLFLTFSN